MDPNTSSVATNELNPSKLGTKDYWDSTYERELVNYEENGDIGEVWFGEDSAEKMVEWLEEHVTERDTPMIDLGCGNGHLLLELASAGFTGLTGVDYSSAAIELAIALAKERGFDKTIHYTPLDLLSLVNTNRSKDDTTTITTDTTWRGRFNVVLDKGTYDAISLHPDQRTAREQGNRGPADLYVDAAAHLLNDTTTGLLLITSCNWTRAELESRFQSHFDYYRHVHYPSFTFGGATGQKISTIAFKKRTN
ncbi:S-adenosyl-L-methionine-dependent methyltransferase [Syncephalis fuscata]|nr:S-adenosyl-L-methionine-dependent methyltransferase [Syncephalis fuscata]